MKQFFSGMAMAGLVLVSTLAWGEVGLNDTQKKEVRSLIRSTLQAQPKLVVDSLIAFRKQQRSSANSRVKAVINKHAMDLFYDKESGVLGNPNGMVTVAEFIDYRCKHCRNMATVIQDVIQHDPNVRVIVKELPIFQGVSMLASKLALAAKQQGRFQVMHEALMSAPLPWTAESLYRLASNVGLNVDQLKADVGSANITARIKRNFAMGRQLDIVGTPAFIVADQHVKRMVFIGGAVTAKQLRAAIRDVQGSHK